MIRSTTYVFAVLLTLSCTRPASAQALSVRGWGSAWNIAIPVPTSLEPSIAIAAGSWHAIAIQQNGSVRAWGDNFRGQCDVPTDIGSVIAVGAGSMHSVALLSNGQIRTWGDNAWNQRNVPADIGPCTAISVKHLWNLALQQDGRVRQWGYNWGFGDVPPDLGSCVRVAAGHSDFLAIRADGQVRAWGNNNYGAGDVPTDLGSCTAITCGAYFSVAIRSDGQVRAWGDNAFGSCDVPADLGSCVDVSAGGKGCVALRADGTVRSWGSRQGDNGDMVAFDVPNDLPPCSSVALGSEDLAIALVQPVPMSLHASDGLSADSVSVGWAPARFATGYDVFRGVTPTGLSSVGSTDSSTTSFTDPNAPAGIALYYAVRSRTTLGDSALSRIEVGYRSLPAPANVVASDGTIASGVVVTWSPVVGASGYRVRRSSSGGTDEEEIAAINGVVTSYTDSYSQQMGSPQYGQVYSYSIQVVQPAGPGVISSIDAGYLKVLPPSQLQASDGAGTAHVTVSWSAPPGATSYQVFRAEGNSALLPIGTTNGATSFSDVSALPGVEYAYAVKAIGNPATNISDFSSLDGGYRRVAAPTGLQASDGTSQQHVLVTWNLTPGATEYRVLRGTTPQDLVQIASVGNVNQFADTSALPGTLFYYAVRGASSPGVGDTSTVDTGYRALSAPTSVQASDGTIPGQIAVTWSAVSGATGYRVLRAVGAGTAIEVGSIAGGTTTTFNDVVSDSSTSPQYGQVYNYSIRAMSSVGELGPASSVDAGYLKMASPTGLAATDGTVADGVTVTWTASPGATDYQVFRAVGTANPTLLGNSAGATSYTDSTAVIGTLYSYRVKSVGNPAGNVSDLSAADSGYRTLVAPVGVQASDGTSMTQVTVVWGQAPGATGYKVLRGLSADALAQVGTTSGASATTFNDTGAPSGVPLFYAVKAVTAAGDGPPSATDIGYRGIGAPANVQASDGTSTSQVNVTWSAVAGATGYRVFRAVGSGTPVEVGTVEGGSTLSFADAYSDAGTSPQYGQVYNYTVRALSAAGPGAASAANAGHLKLLPPTDVSATDGASGANVVVTWTASPGATGYRVFRAEGSAAPAQVGTTTGATTLTNTSAVPGRIYSYTVRATGNPSGNVSDLSTADTGYRALAAPTNVQATDGTSAAHVRVTWGGVTGATGYEVLRAEGGGTPTVVGSSATTSFNDTTASASTVYQYSVRSTGPAGVAASAASASNAGHLKMAAPTGVTATDGTVAGGVTVTWTASPGATDYQVFRAVGTATPTQLGTSAGATTFTDGTAVVGTLYSYRVKSVGSPAGNVSDLSAADSGYRTLVAPGGVSASDGTFTNRVTVTWSQLPGSTGYKVLRGTSADALAQVGTTSGIAATTYNDTGAPSGVTLHYAVRAVTAAGDGPSSATDTGYRGIVAPANVQASDGTSTSQVNVTWSAVAGATGYRVFRAVGSGTPVEVGTVEGGSTLSFADAYSDAGTSPQYGQVYNYTVRALSAAGPGAASAANAGHLKLLPPTDVSATDGASGANVVVTWTASPGATGYRVFRAEGSAAPAQVGTTTGATTLTNTSAVPGRIYSYTVRATGNPSGNVSDLSTADTGYRALAAPTNVQATDGTSAAHVRVTWGGVTGATGYEVLRAEGGGTPTVVGSSATTSFNDTTASASTVYQYSVRSTGPAGVAASAASASNAGHLKMAAPTGVTATDGTVAGGVTVTWTASPGATDYQVFRAVGTATPTQLGTSAGATTFTDGTAVVGTLYSYRVKSVGSPAGNVSDLSAADSGYRTLVAPGGVSASDGTFTNRVTVTWSQLPGSTGYKVLRGTSADALAQVGTTSGIAATTYNDTGAPSGVTLHYAVRAVTAAGDGPSSATDTGYRGIVAPANVQASDGTSAAQVNVTWGAVAGATGYRVLRAVGSATPVEVGSVEGGSTLSFADAHSDAGTSPQYGQVYNYTVRALSAAGPGAASAANAGHLKLLPPTDVSASDGTSGAGVVVTWTASPGATGYRVFRAEGSAAPAQIGTTTGATTLTNTSAVPGRVYSYSVRATGNPSGNVSDPSGADTGYRALAAPTNVLASDGTSAAHVAVTWTAATGAVSYKVFRDGSETPLQSGVTGTAFNDTTAVPGVSYTYAVRSVAAAGDSPLSGSNAGYRQMTAPANVQASDGTLTTGIAVSWNAVPGAVTYQVFRSGTSAAIANVPDLEHVDTPAGSGPPVAGTAYTYTVRAVGAAAGAVSPASAGNAGYRSLAPPTGVAASDGASTANVAVTWTGVTGATGYRIFRAPAGSSAATAVGNVGGAARTFNDTTATPGTWFTYSVAATTSAGPSLPSAGDNGHRVLSVPGSVQATDGTSTAHVRVSWSASAGAGTYEVFRREGSGDDEQVGTVTAPVLLYDDTSAVPGVSYSYSVRAVGITPPEGLEQPLSAKSAVNAGFRQMPAPTGVLASDGTSLTQVAVAWDAVPGAVSYRVFRGTTSIATGITGTSFEDTGAAQGTRFSYTVRAVGAVSSAVSAASAADFGYRNRPGPTALQATDTDLSKVRVTWTLAASGSPAVTGYEVRRIEDGVGTVTLTSTLGATATSYDDNTATPGTTYTYEVRARYTLAGSSPAQVVTTLPGSDTGIRPSAFGSGDGGLAGEDGDGQSGAGEGGVASTETGGSGHSPGSVTGGGMVAEPSPKAPGASEESSASGDDSVAVLSCHDVMAGLLTRIMELEDEIGEEPEADADGSRSRRALLAALRTLLDPVHGGEGAEDPDQPQDGTPRACVMASGDVNCDGTVDGRDFAAFMDAWSAGDEVTADLDRDGEVTSSEMIRLVALLAQEST